MQQLHNEKSMGKIKLLSEITVEVLIINWQLLKLIQKLKSFLSKLKETKMEYF